MSDQDGSVVPLHAWGMADVRSQRVPVASLVPADSPRLDGEDTEHIRMLAESGDTLPPIIVHRATMRIIDGMHRLGAARLRGDTCIEVRFFDGTEQEAFVLAVQTNIAHGRPLSLADRIKAAERIVATHAAWSDRTIAATAGLGARTVGEIRRRIEARGSVPVEGRVRIGRDGRVRPLDNAEGRLRASEVIKAQPNASVRQIAKSAGISPATALDVRNRLRSGLDPVPAGRRGLARRVEEPTPEGPRDRGVEERELVAMLHGIRMDPSLRFNESGRTVLRWILSRAIRPGEWQDMSDRIPSHCTYVIADVARGCAEQWSRVAEYMEKRAQSVA